MHHHRESYFLQIIDVGDGISKLVDDLPTNGYKNISYCLE